jgi:hypothetical protein
MRRLGYIVTVVVAAGLVFGLIGEWLKSFDEGSWTPILVSSSSDDRLTAVAWLDTNRTIADKPFTLHIRFLNRSDEPIQNVAIERVIAEHIKFSPATVLVGALQPHQRSQVVTIQARSLVTSGQHSMVITYAWTDKSGPAMGAVTVGPLTITTTARAAITHIGGPIIGLFKDLALPVVLAVGAWLLQRAEKRREESRKTAEDDRASSLKRAEEQRARTQAAWNLMLPVSHELNTKYYLPIIGAAEKIESAIHRLDPPRITLYWLMSTMRNMRQLNLDKGGLFLKDMRGESTVSEIWALFMVQLRSRFDLATREKVLKAMTWREDFSTFDQRFTDKDVSASLTTLAHAFDQWLAEDFATATVPVLDLFRFVLLYELNRPFSLWYDAPLQFPISEICEREVALQKLANSDPQVPWLPQLTRVVEKVREYRELRKGDGTSPAA